MIGLVEGQPEAVIRALVDDEDAERTETPGLRDTSSRRRQIWFDGADDAYLVAAAIRRYLHATIVSDVMLVPTGRGPAIELPAEAMSLGLVRSLIRRFGGHVEGVVAEAVISAVPADGSSGVDRTA